MTDSVGRRVTANGSLRDYDRQIPLVGKGLDIRMSANPKHFRVLPIDGVNVRCGWTVEKAPKGCPAAAQ